jgi:peptidoglycan/LPS O-acetylase OafA/YrhL
VIGDRSLIPDRIPGLQMLRGLAAGYVLLFHLVPAAGLSEGWPRLASFARWGFSGVDLFFVLSGFVMWHSTTEKVGLLASRQFLALRFARIFSGYWPVLAITMLVFLAIAPQALRDKNILGSVFLLEVDDTRLVISVAWSLSYELFFYCMFAALILRDPRRRLVLVIAIFLLIVLFNYLLVALCPHCLSGNSGDGYFFFSPFVAEFLLGCLVAALVAKTARNAQLAFPVTVSAIFVLALAAWMGTGHGRLPDLQIDRMVYFGLAAAALVYLVAVTGSRINWPRWSVATGDRSYALYLSHPLMISVASISGIFPLHADLRWQAAVTALLFVGVAIGVAHLYYQHIERPLYEKLRRHLRASHGCARARRRN